MVVGSMGTSLGLAPPPSAAQWSLASSRIGCAVPFDATRKMCGLVRVRASAGDRNDGNGERKSPAGLSRRAMVALVATSVQFVRGASAREVSEKTRLEMLRNIQQQRKNAAPVDEAARPEVPSPSPLPDVDPKSRIPLLESTSPSSLDNAAAQAVKDVSSSIANQGAAVVEAFVPKGAAREPEENVSQSVSEVTSGGNVGLALLNSVGVLGGGIAGALYFLERQAKGEAKSGLQSVKTKLKEAESSIASLRETSEGRLREEKEQAQKAENLFQQQRTTLANEIAASKTMVAELQRNLEAERTATDSLQMRISRLQSTLEDEEKSYNSLNDRFEEEKANGEQFQNDIERLKEQIKEREAEFNSKSKNLQEEKEASLTLQAQIEAVESQLLTEQNRIKNLENKCDSLLDEKKTLELVIADLEMGLKLANNIREELAKEVSSQNEVMDSLKLSLKEEQAMKEKISAELMEASQCLEKATADAHLLDERLKKISAAKDTLEKEKDSEIRQLSKELQEKSEMLDSTLSRNQSLCEEIRALESRQEVLNGDLDNTQKELEASTDEIKTISEQLTVAVNLSLKLESQLNEARAAYQSTNKALVEERKVTTAAKNQLAMSQKSLTAEKNSVKALRGSVDQALQALQELNRDSVAIAGELERAKKQISTLESENSTLRQKLAKEKEASAKFQVSSTQAEGTIAKLIKENEAANKKSKQLEGELLKNKGELVRQKGKLSEMKQALQSAESRLESIPQVRAEAALLVEKYEDIVFQEREQKEALMRQNEQLLKVEKNAGTNLTDVKQTLEEGQAARSEMEAALGSLKAVAETSS